MKRTTSIIFILINLSFINTYCMENLIYKFLKGGLNAASDFGQFMQTPNPPGTDNKTWTTMGRKAVRDAIAGGVEDALKRKAGIAPTVTEVVTVSAAPAEEAAREVVEKKVDASVAASGTLYQNVNENNADELFHLIRNTDDVTTAMTSLGFPELARANVTQLKNQTFSAEQQTNSGVAMRWIRICRREQNAEDRDWARNRIREINNAAAT